MSKESLSGESFTSKILEAVRSENQEALLTAVKELNKKAEVIDQEHLDMFDETWREEVHNFLEDKLKIGLVLPFGDSHFTVFREKGKFSIELSQETDEELAKLWERFK